jgi:hypothetical protein
MDPSPVVHNWNRSTVRLGDPRAEGEIQLALAREYPTGTFPFHIDVVGGHSLKDRIAIRFWNNHDVDLIGHVDLAVSASAHRIDGELLWAVMSKVASLIESLASNVAEVKQTGATERRRTERRRKPRT